MVYLAIIGIPIGNTFKRMTNYYNNKKNNFYETTRKIIASWSPSCLAFGTSDF
jgi:hypothetical protein